MKAVLTSELRAQRPRGFMVLTIIDFDRPGCREDALLQVSEVSSVLEAPMPHIEYERAFVTMKEGTRLIVVETIAEIAALMKVHQ